MNLEQYASRRQFEHDEHDEQAEPNEQDEPVR